MLYCVVCPGGGPSCLPSKYHTILELPRKPAGNKRSPLGWKSLFSTKQSSGGAWERKSRAETVTSDQQKVSAPVNVTLRPVSITSISLQEETIQKETAYVFFNEGGKPHFIFLCLSSYVQSPQTKN